MRTTLSESIRPCRPPCATGLATRLAAGLAAEWSIEEEAEAEAKEGMAKLLASITIEEDEGSAPVPVAPPVGGLSFSSPCLMSHRVCASSRSTIEIARRSPARFWPGEGGGRLIHARLPAGLAASKLPGAAKAGPVKSACIPTSGATSSSTSLTSADMPQP